MKKLSILIMAFAILSTNARAYDGDELLTYQEQVKRNDIIIKATRECINVKRGIAFNACAKKVYLREGGY